MPPLSESTPASSAGSAADHALIPDGCRGTVALRMLGAGLLLTGLAGVLAADPATPWLTGVSMVAAVVAPVGLCTLLAWCALRRLLAAAAPAAQRAAAWLVPPGLVLVLLAFGIPFTVDLLSPRALALPLAAAVCGAAAQHYFELRERAYSPALDEARLQALQSRIRPHFLFNSLNAVLAVLRDSPARAEGLLEDLADLFRAAMGDARRLVPLEREIELTRKYLAIEQARLGERLEVVWRIDGAIAAARVPPLLLQPLVENAVRYGVERERGDCRIDIGVRGAGDALEIRVGNPLAQVPVARDSNQIGLANIRERLALIYDLEARLDAGPRDGRFEVSLRLPLAGPR